jgi:hypothetical protein
MQNVCCEKFKGGKCMHQAAPRRFFGPAECILDGNPDVRIKECSLRVPVPFPTLKDLLPPTMRPIWYHGQAGDK